MRFGSLNTRKPDSNPTFDLRQNEQYLIGVDVLETVVSLLFKTCCASVDPLLGGRRSGVGPAILGRQPKISSSQAQPCPSRRVTRRRHLLAGMEDEKEELSIALSKYARDDEHARLLTSKRALTAFHEKCMEFVKGKQSGYLNTDDFTELLGGQNHATPAFLKDLLNKMVANVRVATVYLVLILEFYSILRAFGRKTCVQNHQEGKGCGVRPPLLPIYDFL